MALFGLPEKKLTPRHLVDCSLVELLRHKAFYGHILQQVAKVFIPADAQVGKTHLRTMGVGRYPGEMLVKLYVNEGFVQHLIETSGKEKVWDHVGGVLEHEVLHLVLSHLSLEFSDRVRGGVAKDLAVNSLIDKDRLPNPVLPEDYGFERNESAMWYYIHLKDNKKFQEQCASGAFQEEGMFSDAIDAHKLWSHCEKDPLLKEFVKSLIKKSREICGRDYGNIPSELVQKLDELLKTRRPVIPWQNVLRNFCASATEGNLDYTMKRRSRRFGTRPGTRKEDTLNLAVGVDTSGSISDRELILFFNEIRWIYRNGAMVTVYEADADIQATYRFKGKFTGEVHGHGGTNLEPVLKEVTGKYDALIYFTDFYAPLITHKYNIPVLWVLRTEMQREEFPYKWGRFIKIEDDGRPVAVR
jgi:predicted metal-dependent peptidase